MSQHLNIKVLVRLRPSLSKEEEESKEKSLEDIPIGVDPQNNQISIYSRNNDKHALKLFFDSVITQNTNQTNLFLSNAENVSHDILNGFENQTSGRINITYLYVTFSFIFTK